MTDDVIARADQAVDDMEELGLVKFAEAVRALAQECRRLQLVANEAYKHQCASTWSDCVFVRDSAARAAEAEAECRRLQAEIDRRDGIDDNNRYQMRMHDD